MPAESRALFAKVLGRLEGMRGEMEELKVGKAWSDARIARLEESECECGGVGPGALAVATPGCAANSNQLERGSSACGSIRWLPGNLTAAERCRNAAAPP